VAGSLQRWLDALAFSSALVAAAAAALAAAAGRALTGSVAPAAVALAFAGTLVIYNLDRLRDLERDRGITPERARFVAANRRGLLGLVVGAGAACLPLLTELVGRVGLAPVLWLAPALLLGLLHRRIKQVPLLKPLYITTAWLLVVVALPALASGAPHALEAPRELAWVAAILALAIFANAIASNVRDGEAGAARYGPRLALRAARVLAGLGCVAGVFAPAAARPLAAVPLATLASLVSFRASERYGLLVVDGALLAGGAVALALATG
jgi:4-hydroxybenzoate polyprenyltransferase